MTLRIEDLTPTGAKALDTAYEEANRRARCSRSDFASGWLAFAVYYHVRTVFAPEAWAAEQSNTHTEER